MYHIQIYTLLFSTQPYHDDVFHGILLKICNPEVILNDDLILARCNRLRCPLAGLSGLQGYSMGHNGHGINLYGVIMTPMEN